MPEDKKEVKVELSVLVWEKVTYDDNSHVLRPHEHIPYHVNLNLATPSLGGIMIDQTVVLLCTRCGLAYWRALPQAAPQIPQRDGEGLS